MPASVYNGNGNFRIGNNWSGYFDSSGSSFGVSLVTAKAVNSDALYAAFLDAVYGSGVQTPGVDALMVFDGDSLMAGAGASTTQGDFPAALHGVTGNAWSGNFHWRNIGIGGSGIMSNETQFASTVAPLMSVRGFPAKYYVLWGGTNQSEYYQPSPSNRAALAARYVALLTGAEALGARSVMITPLFDVTRTVEEQGYQDAYVTELISQCYAAGITVVDAHNDPDLRAHTAGFYADSIHLTNTGYERVRAMFVEALPEP